MKIQVAKKIYIFLFYAFLLFPCSAATIYVNVGAGGANNGTTWADAYPSLQDALNTAV